MKLLSRTLSPKNSSRRGFRWGRRGTDDSMTGTKAGGNSVVVFKRGSSSFLRVADLEMDETFSTITSSTDSEESYPNFHHISADPPPGVKADPTERWVVLDNGEGKPAPIAPLAVAALTKSGLEHCYDASIWTPDGKTPKALKQNPEWERIVWQREGAIQVSSKINASEVLVWAGQVRHKGYGSELPAVRSAGLIDMSPKALMELLLDSNRVKEYNKLSLGREDLLVLQDEISGGTFGGITKVMKAETKPPLVRKILQFTSMMHVRESLDGSGYELITRAVTVPAKEDKNALQSEILLGVTILKRVEGNDNRCLFTAVNHLRSPIPLMIAKRIGLQAAIGFVHDLRACC